MTHSELEYEFIIQELQADDIVEIIHVVEGVAQYRLMDGKVQAGITPRGRIMMSYIKLLPPPPEKGQVYFLIPVTTIDSCDIIGIKRIGKVSS